MTVVRPALIAAKLAELADRTARIRARCPATPGELARDRDALDLVSFNLMLAVQSCADIASHIVSDEGWAAASTLVTGFRRLGEHHVVSEQTVESLCRAVGRRNVVAHGYGGVDADLVFAAATGGVADLERFSLEVAEWTAGRESPR